MRDTTSSQNLSVAHQPGMRRDGPTQQTRNRNRNRTFRACKRCRLYRTRCGEKPCEACRLNNVKCVVEEEHDTTSSSKLRIPAHSMSKWPAVSLDTSPAAPGIDSTAYAPEDEDRHEGAPLPELFDRTASISSPSSASSVSSRVQKFQLLFHGLGQAPALEPAPTLFLSLPQGNPQSNLVDGSVIAGTELLNRNQQAYFVRLFWTSWGPLFPLMAEAEFESLFAKDWFDLVARQTVEGALIDGMTALGIQCSHAVGAGGRLLGRGPDTARRSSIAYFKRCRDHLRGQGSHVSVDAIRCYILLALYQLQANRVEDAYYTVGLGVRRAHMSRLHLTPAASITTPDAVGRVRVWWLLSWLDLHCSMQLDQPTAVQRSAVTCPPPPDPQDDLASDSGWTPWRDFSPWQYLCCLSKLTAAVVEALDAVITIRSLDEIDNSSQLEESAVRLFQPMNRMEKWFASLPEPLVNPRERVLSNGGISAPEIAGSSAAMPEKAPIALVLGVPDWLQRQRIMLELHYHNACVLLQRPYVLWQQSSELTGRSGLIKYHAEQAIRHACFVLSILYSIYSKSDILDGLTMTLQFLWNAIITIAAQIFVHPYDPQTAPLSESLSNGLAILESLSRTNLEALHVYQVSYSVITQLQDGPGSSISISQWQNPFQSGSSPARSAALSDDALDNLTNFADLHGFMTNEMTIGHSIDSFDLFDAYRF